MNMTQKTLEILIGKYLDGEITPGEQQLLETALEEDSQAKELFEQLQDLHRSSRQVVASEMLGRGKAPDEIFEQAWQQKTKLPSQRVIKAGGYLRFTVGLAAGLVIGIALHFTLLARPTPQSSDVPPNAIMTNDVKTPPLLITPPEGTENVIRNIDWFSFTDEAGDQWLVEGLRESIVRPAVYYEGL